MHKFKNIVLTTDLSPNAEAAVPFAVALAKQSGATIHIFHAFEHEMGEDFTSRFLAGTAAWRASVRKQREEKLNQFAESLALETGIKVTQTCVHGHPGIEAVKFAQEVHADLIVLSTHGRTGIQHMFLGSVAEKILRLSSIPVLTVRPGEIVPDQMKFKTILVATDFSDNADAALPYAVALAKGDGARLVLAHVVENSTYYSDPTWSVGVGPDIELWNETIKAQGQKKLAEAAAKLSAVSNVDVTPLLKCGRAHEEICNIARECKADLVVMSTHGYTGFSHLTYGSVAERVLRSCPVPMLSIHPALRCDGSELHAAKAV